MKIKFNFLIYFILGLIIYFYTPLILSNIFFGIIIGSVKLLYIDNDNNLISYTFNHGNYDGKLIAYTIQQELVKYKKIQRKIHIYDFKSYQYLNNNRVLDFSKFTSSISYFLKEILFYQKRDIKICIFVSIRNKIKDPTVYGNFIKFACCKLTPSDNIYDICLKIQTSIKNAQSKNYFNKNTTIYDIFSLYDVDYIFNNRRDLSSIYTKNNKLLIKQSTINISEKDIINLKLSKQRKLILLDFFDNKYIISQIVNI